jgi:hypothetical protein
MQPVFKEGGTVPSGNASGINDERQRSW